jgi:HK97 gp10 family phage protein
VSAKLEGFVELSAQLKALSKSCNPDDVEAILVKGAKVIVNAAKAKAPQGPTGRLKRSIKVKKMRSNGMNPAPVLAAVDRKVAPHAHFIELGTSTAPAYPFFRPAVDETEGIVTQQIVQELNGMIDKAVR